MREIRFISGDSQSLILETQDGEKYRLGLDRSILDAIKREPSAASSANLTPREIQDAIRSGASVEDLAASSGDSIEYVLKFALPVLEELSHMLASALAVRVEIEPDRFNERRFREFGVLMDERLRNGGATEVQWAAHRESPFIWAIRANYSTGAGEGSALWHFDPRALTMTPEDTSAVGLTNASTFGDAPIPKLVPLVTKQEGAVSTNAATTLLDAFAARRQAAAEVLEEAVVEDEPQEFIEVVEIVDYLPEPELKQEPEAIEDLVEEPADIPTSTSTESARKGRAPMPSWDEIIFGTKAQDDE